MKKRNIALAALVVVLGAVALTYSAAPKKFSITAPCLPDPAAKIASLPSGGTFTGAGNCYTTHGITITKPVTINGGSFYDPDNSVPPQTTHGAVPLPPIIKILATHNVTVENVHLYGANYSGGFNAALVNNAGIEVLDSSNVTLTNIHTANTFGDGLELWTAKQGHGDTNVTVNGFWAANAGRLGFTIALAQHVVMNNVHGKSYSFETDSGPQVAPGFVTLTNCSVRTLINIPNAIDGPVTFDHCTGSAQITVANGAANPAHGIPASPVGPDPITISNSQIATPANSYGYPPSGIFDNGGVLNLVNDTFTRTPAPKTTGKAWAAVGGSVLNITHTTFVKPLGIHDASSTVEVVK